MEVREPLESRARAGPARGPVGEQHQHRQPATRAPSTSSRSRESGSIQWQSSRISSSGASGAAPQARREQPLERRLAQLGVERRGELVVGDGEPERRRRAAARAARALGRSPRAPRWARLLGLGASAVEAEQRSPDRAPDDVAHVGAEGLALARATRRRAAGAARRLGQQARLAHPRLGRDRRRRPVAARHARAARRSARARRRGRPSAARPASGARAARSRCPGPEDRHRRGLALDRQRRQRSHSNSSPAACRTAPRPDRPGGAAAISRAARFTASPRQQ